jgi:hypothetical protein
MAHLSDDDLESIFALCDTLTLTKLLLVSKQFNRIAESELWSEIVIISKKVPVEHLIAFHEAWDLRKDQEYYEQLKKMSKERDLEERMYDDEQEEDGVEMVQFYSMFLCRHWMNPDFELCLRNYVPGDITSVEDIKFLGLDENLKSLASSDPTDYLKLDSEFENLDLFTKFILIFQGDLNQLLGFCDKQKRKISSYAITLVFVGIRSPIIEFATNFSGEYQLKLEKLYIGGLSCSPRIFEAQFHSLEKFSRLNTILDFGAIFKCIHLSNENAVKYLRQIISQSLELKVLFWLSQVIHLFKLEMMYKKF